MAVVPWPVIAQSNPIAAAQICASSAPFFVGPCVTIHSRLQRGAGNVGVWIWPVGTKRYLGWAGKALRCSLPTKIETLTDSGKTVYANIAIRPVSRSRPGHMQFVCIASADNIVVGDGTDSPSRTPTP